MSALRRRTPDSHLLRAGDEEVALRIRRSPRATRISIRLDPVAGDAELVLPDRARLSEALAFAERRPGWLIKNLSGLPAAIPFVDGAEVPYRGIPHAVRQRTAGPRPVWRDQDEAGAAYLNVKGRAEHLPRRLTDWFKAEARQLLDSEVKSFAAQLNRKVAKLRIGDPMRQWGSCSSRGVLSFSWRLVLAPDFVREYVAAHEVAHLIEANHGARFWRLTAELFGDADRMDSARDWLRRNGAKLHRYGR